MTAPREHWTHPRDDLRPWVSRIGCVRSDAPQRFEALYAPCAEPALLVRWSYDGGVSVSAIGPLLRARRKSFESPARYARLVLRAGHARAVLGAPVGELADRVVPIDELWGAGGARLREALAAVGPPRAMGLVATAVAARARRADVPNARAASLQRAMHALDAGGRVASAAAALGVSERHLRRLFHEEVGMTPKHYARVARLSRALSHRGASWAATAYDAGFYDQSHLHREFRDLLQVTPENYLHGERPRAPDRALDP